MKGIIKDCYKELLLDSSWIWLTLPWFWGQQYLCTSSVDKERFIKTVVCTHRNGNIFVYRVHNRDNDITQKIQKVYLCTVYVKPDTLHWIGRHKILSGRRDGARYKLCKWLLDCLIQMVHCCNLASSYAFKRFFGFV